MFPAYVLRSNNCVKFFAPYFPLIPNSLFKYLFEPFKISFIETSTWSDKTRNIELINTQRSKVNEIKKLKNRLIS